MQVKLMRITGLLVAIATGAVACGGSGNNSDPQQLPGPSPVAGITRTGAAVAVGPVSAFGSIVVNGISYDTSAAVFTVDGQAATQNDLSIGDMVIVKGTIDDDNTNAAAESVEFDDNVEGPVTSVDTVANSLVVLGQTVFIDGGTSIDDSCPATLNDFLTVAAVEVSGYVRADGSVLATRIECKAVAGELEVSGVVSNLGADTFMINALVVDFTAVPATIDNFPTGTISNGDPVEVKGTNLGGAGELLATRVEFKGARFDDNEGDHIEIEGFITRFASATDFDVSGLTVTTISGTTVFEGGSAADLGLNLKVEVEGEFDADGVLVATKVEIKPATSVRITAQLDSVSGNSFVILGITVNTDARTRFEDKSAMSLKIFGVGDLNPGDYVEIRGQEFPAASGEIFAAIAERDDPDTEAIIQGFVDVNGVNRPALTVLGVTIETNAGTTFQDVDDSVFANPDDFWNLVSEGSLIKAKGTETAIQTIVADEVELEQE